MAGIRGVASSRNGVQFVYGGVVQLKRLSTSIVVAFLAAACGVVVTPSGEVTTLQLNAPPAGLTAGEFAQVAFTARNAAGATVSGRTPAWSTSNANVLRVTTTGVMMAVGPGTATLTGRLDRGTAQTSVTVAARAIPAGQVQFFLGPEETVFDYATQRCEGSDIPDNEARAVRLADGSILLLAANDPRTHLMRGADFDHLARDCRDSLTSLDDASPQSYRNREWLWALYRIGGTIHALAHNEFHDRVAANCKPGDSGPANPCWYNSATYMRSTDNGVTFAPLAGAPAVAPAPVQWDASNAAARSTPHGYFNPSNIVRASDGFYYSLVFSRPTPTTTSVGACVMRTRDVGDPASWRAWDGTAFSVQMSSPYAQGPAPGTCRVVLSGAIYSSLTWNTYLGRYVALSNRVVTADDGTPTCGIAYALSADLVRWSGPRLLMPLRFPTFNGANPCPGPLPANNLGAGLYGSLLDHTSQSINFETAGQTPYLYNMTYVSAASDAPRNLVRRPVIILKGPGFNGDIAGPQMFLDAPAANATVSGSAFRVRGWAFDDTALARVEILVDGAVVGTATGGVARPDIPLAFPGAPGDSGFFLDLDTRTFANGTHTITARAVDTAGNASSQTVSVTVSN